MCDNKVIQYIPRGWDYREDVQTCGNTGYNGERLICDECQANADKMAQIKRQQANADADNAWLRSAGWGEI